MPVYISIGNLNHAARYDVDLHSTARPDYQTNLAVRRTSGILLPALSSAAP